MSTKTCPLCKKTLSLQQVNLNVAVFMCEDLNCKYPVGYDCTVVERKLEDIDKPTDNLAGKDNLDDWIHEVVANNEKTQPVPSVTVDLSGAESENHNRDPARWIDDLVAEAVNEARRYEASKEVTRDSNSESVDMDLDDLLNFL